MSSFLCHDGFYQLVWSERLGGIHPGRSVLTLMVIVHFNAKAHCCGMFQNEGPSRFNTFKTFSSDSTVKCGVMGLESFFLFP